MKPIRRQPGKMNKTEAQHAWTLEAMKRTGEILDYRFDEIGFRLGDNTFYYPDFFVTFPDHFEIHEVKGGFIREDSLVKFQAAARLWPQFRWKMHQKTAQGWKLYKEY